MRHSVKVTLKLLMCNAKDYDLGLFKFFLIYTHFHTIIAKYPPKYMYKKDCFS